MNFIRRIIKIFGTNGAEKVIFLIMIINMSKNVNSFRFQLLNAALVFLFCQNSFAKKKRKENFDMKLIPRRASH